MLKPPPSSLKVSLCEYADDALYYEARMFTSVRDISKDRNPVFGGNRQLGTNVVTEVCALHLRNLICFFYGDAEGKTKGDDISAEHYAHDWKGKRPEISEALERARARANKELAHLTVMRQRGGPPEKMWRFDELSRELRGTIQTFLASAPNLSERTVDALQRI